jgi:hypothetical protein
MHMRRSRLSAISVERVGLWAAGLLETEEKVSMGGKGGD